MNKFLKPAGLIGGVLIGFFGISWQANAHLLPGGVVIDFEADSTNGQPMPAAVFPAFSQVYIEDGVEHSAIGFGTAPGNSIGVNSGGTSHMHGANTGGSRVSQHEADAGGGLFQLADGDPFAVKGFDVAGLNLALTDGSQSTMTLRGYTSADFSTFVDVILGDDGAGNPIGLFDTDPGLNGTHVHLDDIAGLQNIYLFEYFFNASGRGNNPGTNPLFADLLFEIDNLELDNVAAVPVPAAVYLFGAGLLGLFGVRKKQSEAVAS